MNNSDKLIFGDTINKVKYDLLCQSLQRLESTISRLRESFKANNEKLKKLESKIYDPTFKEMFPIEFGRQQAYISIYRRREEEIKNEGIRLKLELEKLCKRRDELKKSLTVSDENYHMEAQQASIKWDYECRVGSKWLRVAESLFSSKICKEVFYPIVGDWQEDYLRALSKGRIFDAAFISIRNYFIFAYTMIVCSRFGKLIEFMMKVVDAIEFFNKFSR